jgi:hypothetical protein
MAGTKEVHTFKLETKTLLMLQQAALRQGISPNAFAERILSEYLNRDLFAKSFGWVAVGKKTLHPLLLLIDPEDLAKMGIDEGKKNFVLARETSQSHKRDLSLLEFVVEVLGHQAKWFEVEGEDVGPERIVLRHEWGMNWSVFLKSYLLGASEVAPGMMISVEPFEDFVRVSFGSKSRF